MLLGLPLTPVWWLFGGLAGSHLAGALVSAYLSALAVVTIAFSVWIAYRVLPVKLRPLAILLTVPLILATSNPDPGSKSSIAALLSALPVRTLPLVVVALLLPLLARAGWRRAAAVGFVAGTAALNNFEFGVPVALAALITLVANQQAWKRGLKASCMFSAAAALPFVAYALLQISVGQPFHPEYWVAYAMSYGTGFGAVPMPIFGLYVLVLAILIAGAVTGWYHLRTANRTAVTDRRMTGAAMVALFFGLAGLGSFGYYVGQSVVSGELQIFLFYLAPIIAASLTLVPLPRISRGAGWRPVTTAAVVLFPVALALSSVINAPNAQDHWDRVTAANETAAHFPFDDSSQQIADALTKATAGQEPVASGAVPYGNLVQSYADLQNFSAIDDPYWIWVQPNLKTGYCARLAQAPGPVLVQSFNGPEGQPACTEYLEMLRISDYLSIVKQV